MSVLFCDLVGFTAASEQADPEDVDTMLSAYAEMARSRIEAHGGVVEKFIGDAVVGVFGVPAAHEDDPERAVRAGLRIVEAAEELEAIGGAPLRLRVGVNTGETLVRLGANAGVGERVLAGDAINTASRLQSVAPEMGVAVGLSTFEATSVVFEYEELDPAAGEGEGGAGQGVPREGGAGAVWHGSDSDARQPLHRPRDRSGAPEGRLRQDSGLQLRAVGDGGGGAGLGEVTAGGGAVRLYRWAARVDDVAAGQVFAVWGGDHVLGVGGDPEGPYRHPRIRSARGRRGEAGRGVAGGGGAGLVPAAAAAVVGDRGYFQCGAGGVVHGLAPVPGRGRGGAADRARVRGSALGRRGDARVPGAPGRPRRRRSPADRRHGPAGAVRALPRLRREAAERQHDQPGAALAGGDGPSRLGAARCDGDPGGVAAADPRPGRWQPPVCGGVRPPAEGPGICSSGRARVGSCGRERRCRSRSRCRR